MIKKQDLVKVKVYNALSPLDSVTQYSGIGYLIDTFKVKACEFSINKNDFDLYAKVSLFKRLDQFNDNEEDIDIMVNALVDRMTIINDF